MSPRHRILMENCPWCGYCQNILDPSFTVADSTVGRTYVRRLCPDLPGHEATNVTAGTPFAGEMIVVSQNTLLEPELTVLVLLAAGGLALIRRRSPRA